MYTLETSPYNNFGDFSLRQFFRDFPYNNFGDFSLKQLWRLLHSATSETSPFNHLEHFFVQQDTAAKHELEEVQREPSYLSYTV